MFDMPDVDIDFGDRTQLLKHVPVQVLDLKMETSTTQVFTLTVFHKHMMDLRHWTTSEQKNLDTLNWICLMLVCTHM